MEIEEIRILPTKGRDISFSGELIAQATSERQPTPVGDRWFDLRVYNVAGGGFVPIIEFHTTVDGEDDVTIAERVDRWHDIENFYFVFEPCEVIPEKLLAAMRVEERQKFTTSLLKLYDAPVNRVLVLVKARTSERDAEHRDLKNDESRKAKAKGSLNIFGRGS